MNKTVYKILFVLFKTFIYTLAFAIILDLAFEPETAKNLIEVIELGVENPTSIVKIITPMMFIIFLMFEAGAECVRQSTDGKKEVKEEKEPVSKKVVKKTTTKKSSSKKTK